MTEKRPKVSIVIPAYNAEKCLADAVENVLAQQYGNIEIVIVNDGSTDGTAKVAKKLADNNKIIKIVTQENRGLGEARNAGMTVVQGEYVVFLDADDFLFPWAIEKLLDAALTTDADIVCGEMIESASPKETLANGKDQSPEIRTYDNGEGYIDFLYGRIRTSACAKLYKVAAIKKLKFSAIRHAEDLEYNLRAFKKIKKISVLVEPLVEVYTISPGSMTHSSYNEKRQEEMTILRQIQKGITVEDNPAVKKALKAGLFFHALGMICTINDNPEARQQYADDFKELKKMIRKCCRSVAFDKKALPSQKRYALAACTSVEIMLKMMQKAAK